MASPVLPPLSLYVHWPWCVRKCPYCDFNSRAAPRGLDEGRYIEALLRDLESWSGAVRGRELSSIYLGGGTPSLMTPGGVARLLSGIRSWTAVAEKAEVTLEANPGTVTEGRLEGYRTAGVNRVSLGVQSFSDERLQSIGRIHSAREALEAAQAVGRVFENFNLDLMFALPNESEAELKRDLELALASGAKHLSFYQLTIEEGTAFAKTAPEGLPDEDRAADMADLASNFLERSGFEHYEVSGYAKPGFRSRHNMNYWTFGDYLAVGAGAHGKVTLADGSIVREVRAGSPSRYVERVEAAGSGAESREVVGDEALPFEFMLNVLRLREGVPKALFSERTGRPFALLEKPFNEAVRRGLLSNEPDRMAASPLGRRFLSDLQEIFLP